MFGSTEQVEGYSHKALIIVKKDVKLYDLDKILKINICLGSFECRLILEFWNIVHDLAYSLGKTFLGDLQDSTEIYNKLFYGVNLPSLSMKNKFDVNWKKDELTQLASIISEGLTLINRYVFDEK